MDVRMPDGTIVTGVPEGITQTELLARYNKYTPEKPVERQPQVAAKTPNMQDEPIFDAMGNVAQGLPGLVPTTQNKLQISPSNSINAQDYLAAVAARKEENPDRTISGTAVDAGVTFLKAAIGLPESFVGLADIPTAGYVGRLLEQNGYKPKEAKEILDTYLSEAQQAANRKVKDAQGFGPTLAAALQNPSVILSSAAESLPQMVGGAGVARGLMKAAPSVAPWLAGAIGEGVLGAGSAAEQIRQGTDNGLLTTKQSLSALGSGAGTAVFGAVAGRLASKLGLDDVETMLASGASGGKSKSVVDFAKRAGASGVSEGVFEEMPQSAQEQMWMNYATDKPIMDGVAEASAMGLVTGAAMGMAGTGAGQLMGRKEQEKPIPSAEQMMRDRGFLVPEQKKPAGIAALVEPNAPKAQPPAAPVTPTAQEEQPSGIAALQPKAPEVPVQKPVQAAQPAPAAEESVDRDAMLAELEDAMGTKPEVKQVTPTQTKEDRIKTLENELVDWSLAGFNPEDKPEIQAIANELNQLKGIEAQGQEPAAAGRPGYDTQVTVNAQALKNAFEQSSGEPIITKPAKLEAWRSGTAKTNPVTSPVEVGFGDNGKFGINDGRHRIALAAERGENIDVMVDGADAERLQDFLSKPAIPAAKPEVTKPATGPASRAPDVLDLKKYTPAEVKAEWERSSEGRRRSNLARLENPAIEQKLLGKSWEEMTAEEHKLVRSAYDEDFFSPQWYINKQGSRVTIGPKQAPVEKSQQQLDMERGKEIWDGLNQKQKFDSLLSAGIGKDAEQGQYSTWENLGPDVRDRILQAKAPTAQEAETPKLTPDEIYVELRNDEKKGRAPDLNLIKSMDLETAKAVSDKYRRYRINNFGMQGGETTLRKALDEHIKSIPQPSYEEIMAEVKAKQGNTPTQLQRWQKEHEEVEKQLAELQAKEVADKDFNDALSDLSMILTKGVRKNMMPEQEQALLPVLTRLMDAAFRKGYYKFKEAAKYVIDTIRSKLGDDAADMISLDHLQGAYIGMAGKYQDQGASSKKDVVSVETLDELNEAPAEEEALFTLSNPEQKFEVAQAIAAHFAEGSNFPNIVAARAFISQKFGIEIRPGSESAKQADETIEAGVVLAARDIVENGRKEKLTVDQIYEKLVDLYDRQPNLSVRSSTSVANQAYSTPAPLAYVASELAGITNKTSVYEPTAGNGMLLIGANPSNVVANELNKDRFDMLKQILPGAEVVNKNGMTFQPHLSEVVIANPPFGAIGEEVSVNGINTREIDHAISYNSLGRMQSDGRAVLIVGGVQEVTDDERREKYRSAQKRNFYYNLYKDYNVVDHFTVAGNMYAKQGTSYPVDVIVIDGKGQAQRNLPAADLPQVIKSYDQLKEKLNDRMVSGQNNGTSRTDRGVGEAGQTGREDVDLGTGRQGNGPSTTGRGATEGGEPSVSPNGPSTSGQREPTGGRTGNAQPKSENTSERGPEGGAVAGTGETTGRNQGTTTGSKPSGLGGASIVSGERVRSGLSSRVGTEEETTGQVTYTPHSNASAVGTLVPRAMAQSIEESLDKVEAAEGNLDEYVGRSLEMDPETVRELFSGEQIDALALAIRNAEAGKGFIIGDQTGVGKGRVVAGMIKYALINGKIPFFVTQAPNLYSDMIRDLDAIGMTDELGLDTAKPKILITNRDETIPYTLVRKVNGEKTETKLNLKSATSLKLIDAFFKKMQENESIGEYKVIFTTYKQMATRNGKVTERMRFIQQFGAGNYMIFDESHGAGGSGGAPSRGKKSETGETEIPGTAGFVRKLVNNAFGTFFSSATYAKRPDVMDLYSSTDMKLAVNKISELADAIKNGGIPMQQVVANMLTQAGQYIRRERTFAGVAYNTQETKVDKQTAENMATSMRDILAFSREKEIVVKAMQKEMDKRGEKIGGSGEKTSITSVNFGSTMHNLIDQMLLSLKAKESVSHAIERLKANEKVVMTVSNTMGSFLKDYADEMGLATGDSVDLSFKDLYKRYLEKQRIIKIKPPGKTSLPREYRLTDNDLGPALVQKYKDIENFIDNAGFGSAPISPIDYMHAELQKAGYKTDEITGRSMVLSYANEKPVLTSRKSDIRQRVNAVDSFNNGKVDVIILNQAGSTGLSLHASSEFDDTRKRHMIIVQAEKNIDIHMQMLGRVHRTGQVLVPSYSQMMADIPAELRPAAVLLKKMASLSANTTASRKSAVSAEGAVDFMNDYGGQVAQEYLRDNRDVYEAIGEVVDLVENPTEGDEEDIRKLTGYIPLLPIKQQEEIYKDLIERYNDLIERENSMGSNKLEAQAVDLDAKTIESKQITEDKGDPSVFAQPAMMERVDVKRTVKPYSQEDVKDQIKENLDGKSATAFGNELLRGINDRVNEFRRAQLEAMQSAPEPDQIKIENLKSQLLTQYSHAKAIVQTFPIGTPVSIKNTNGVFIYGVVTDLESKGKTKNPVAGSDMKMTLALANGESKSTTLTFSQIGSTYTLKQEDEIQWLNPETLKGERIPLMELFDKGATVRREKRWMVTGNILAGYAAVNNIGQIMTYTKEDGTTAQGILMPRTFDFEKEQKNAPVKLNSVDAVMSFFKQFGPRSIIGTPDSVLKIIYMGQTQYRFSTSSAKREGGTFFLDKDLTNITGDFYKSGQVMSATVYNTNQVENAVKYLLSERGDSLVALTNKDEARKAFQPTLANIEPDQNQKMLNPDMAADTDREKLIRRFQSARQSRAAIVRKFIKGEAGLTEQAKITELDEVANSLKAAIAKEKPERRTAGNFFADATKQWDEGNLSDAVYSVIKDAYEKYPFVLEDLKLSVRKQPENLKASGQFNPASRFVFLYKGTSGVEDASTIRHEFVHSLEQMMSEEATVAVIEDWHKKLEQKIKSDKTSKGKAFFEKLMAFYDNPSMESYEIAMDALPSYDYYQYMNPSEYWAVNAESLMARKLGSGWDRFVLAVQRLYEGVKNVFGFDNKYAVHKAFNEVMSGKAKRIGQAALVNYVTAEKVLLNNVNTRLNYRGKEAPLSTWTSPEITTVGNWQRRLQDKHVDTKNVVDTIRREMGDMPDIHDPRLMETLYYGRVRQQKEAMVKTHIIPLLQELIKFNITREELNTYLHNRHAETRNNINAARGGMEDGGSGIFTEDARKYLSDLRKTPEHLAKLEKLAARVDTLIKDTQDHLIETGQEQKEVIESWRENMPDYVPLKRDPDELDFVSVGTGLGQGFASKGSFSKASAGSLKTVDDILGNVTLQAEKAIVRGEKARVGRAMYGLAITAPNPEFWLPISPDAIKSTKKLEQELISLGLTKDDRDNIMLEPRSATFDKQTGKLVYKINPALRNSKNVFPIRINGKDRYIIFNAGDPVAMHMVEALKNLDVNGVSEGLSMLAEATRQMASMNTQYNLVFGMWNFARDVGEAGINLSNTPIANKRTEVVKNSVPAVRAIYRSLRGKEATSPEMKIWMEWHKLFADVGGQVGYSEQFRKNQEGNDILAREMKRLENKGLRKGLDISLRWMSDFNDAAENAVRLSAFRTAVENGMSEMQAARLAKEITVNFDRKGSWTGNLNAFWAFFNARVQGQYRNYETLTETDAKGNRKLSKIGMKIIKGGMLFGVLQAFALMIGGFDDDDIPEYIKNKNLIIPIFGTKKYLAFPMPPGFAALPATGRVLGEFAFSGFKHPGKRLAQITGIVFDTLNPLGSSDFAQTIAPTIFDPIVAVLATNKDAFGRQIHREARPNQPSPGWTRTRENASTLSKALAYGINYISGGGEHGIGYASPTGDDIDYLAGQYAGGAAREVMRAGRFVGALFGDEPIPSYRVPVVGKAYGDSEAPVTVKDKFYQNVNQLAQYENELKMMKNDYASKTEYKRNHPETSLITDANNLENQISRLNKYKKEQLEKEQTPYTKSEIKRIEEQKIRMMTNFNKRFTAAE